MGELLNLALAAAEAGSLAVRRPRISAARAAVAIGLGAAVATSVLGAALCGLVSLWLYELPRMGPVAAPLAVAAVLIGAAVIFCALLWYYMTPHRTAAPPPDAEAMLATMSELVKTHKMPSLVAAFVAGLSAGVGK